MLPPFFGVSAGSAANGAATRDAVSSPSPIFITSSCSTVSLVEPDRRQVLIECAKPSLRDRPQGRARNLCTPASPICSQARVHGFRARGLVPAPRNDIVFQFPDNLLL